MTWYPGADRPGTELEPGVRVERRNVLLAAFAAPLALAPRVEDDDPPGFEGFLDLAAKAARPLMGPEVGNEDAYLYSLASHLATVTELPADGFGEIDDGLRFARDGERSAGDAEHQRIRAIQIGFAPGAAIPIHDHLEYNGLILCLDGEMRCRNFDVVEEKDGGEVVLRETVDALLTPGRFSTLSTTRDNLHELVAGPNGCRVLDVFTYFTERATSRYLKFAGEAPLDAARKTFAARWS